MCVRLFYQQSIHLSIYLSILYLGSSGYAVQLLVQSYRELAAPSDATAATAAAAATASATTAVVGSPRISAAAASQELSPVVDSVSESGALPVPGVIVPAALDAAGVGAGGGAFAGDAASAGGAAFVAGDSATAATDGSGAEAVADAGGGDAGG